jgi:hypothetical protein
MRVILSRSHSLADRILKGAKVAELTVQYTTKFPCGQSQNREGARPHDSRFISSARRWVIE